MASKTTAKKVLAAAKGEIREKKYGKPNKYSRWYYGNETQAPWCGIFIKYVIEKLCGNKELLEGCSNVAYVPTIHEWAKKKGYVKYSGEPGDLVIFDWNCGNGVAERDHVGFMVKDNKNGTITTYEGNTSSISNGNGDCVQQRIRDKKFVLCYVRLPYKKTTTKKVTKKKYTGEFPTALISVEKGTKTNIKRWQKFLNWALDAGLTVDGIFGTMSMKATKEFQRTVGILDDGIAGTNTITKAKKYEK